MNSVIICEGPTDFVLLQYYMRKVHSWEDADTVTLKYKKNIARDLSRSTDKLTIMSSGGCGNIIPAFINVLENNLESIKNKNILREKVVIITDRDEEGTEEDIINKVNKTLTLPEYNAKPLTTIANNRWTDIEMNTSSGIPCNFKLLLMVIPFTKKGAMETFLLDVISSQDPYDAKIIELGKDFVRQADPQPPLKDARYLTKRGYRTKAEFDAYFCIRTASDQFVKRQDILKGIPWEDYPKIQEDFKLLGDL